MFIFFIVSTTMGMMGNTLAAEESSLPENIKKAKEIYNNKMYSIQSTSFQSSQSLNNAYQRGLDNLKKKYQTGGDFDAWKFTDEECKRFENHHTVSVTNTFESPDALNLLQHKYIKNKDKIKYDRDLQIAKLTKSYSSYIDKSLKKLTKAGDFEAALAVKTELEAVSKDIDLSILDGVQKKSEIKNKTKSRKKKTSIAKTKRPYERLSTSSNIVRLYAHENGKRQQRVKFGMITKGSNKIDWQKTDTLGIIDFKAKADKEYRLIHLSPKYKFQEIKNIKSGKSYTFDLKPAPKGHGVVVVKSKRFDIPHVGTLRTGGHWSSSDGDSGPSIMPVSANIKFRSRRNSRWQSYLTARSGVWCDIKVNDKIKMRMRIFAFNNDEISMVEYEPIEK
jgi:hypothetical protein